MSYLPNVYQTLDTVRLPLVVNFLMALYIEIGMLVGLLP